jgi:hypothetical protein
MRRLAVSLILLAFTALTSRAAAPAAVLAAQQALLQSLEIKAAQLMPLQVETVLVAEGKPVAVICHSDEPAWRTAALVVQQAIQQATGVTLDLRTDAQLDAAQADSQNVILLGHLDNNRHVARLYHNFFVTLDQGSHGKTGYELRSVHDPFGARHNAVLVGGSGPEGTQLAAARFAAIVKERGQPGTLTLGRLLEFNFDPAGKAQGIPAALTQAGLESTVAATRKLFKSPGQGGSGASRVAAAGLAFHRTGDALQGQLYKALMAELLDYYRTNNVINEDGMARYDNDFRDSWTWRIAVLWDLLEESGLFSDQERRDYTNLLIRLALECELYQGWDRPDTFAKWAANQDIIHNHNSFPGLGALFVGNYCKRHYGLAHADRWLTVAHGMFNGQKRAAKPLEDAASYQWLPIIHTMVYSLAENDLIFFTGGQAREAAKGALMVLDSAGSECAYGDHESERSSYGIAPLLQMAGWYYQDAGLLYGARLANGGNSFGPLDQEYNSTVSPVPPADQVGVTVSRLPRQAYDYVARAPASPTPPNLPLEQTFDKLALRAGWDPKDEYLLLDGMGRGTHMHFDANAIIRFSKGGEPLLVDGEYIRNAPKYHNSLVILRDGQGEPTPPVTGLGRADNLGSGAYTRTWLTGYNGTDWTRCLLWRRNDYLLVSDEVRATQAGNYTLRCCWRPWGDATLAGSTVVVSHPPLRLVLSSLSGAPCRLEALKTVERMPVSRFSQQVGLRLEPGQSYRFLNLIYADPSGQARHLQGRQVGDGVAVIERPEGADVVAFGPGLGQLPGLTVTAELALLAPDRLLLAGCTNLAGKQVLVQASAPLSLEIVPSAGTATVSSTTDTELTVRLQPGAKVTVGDASVTAAADGLATLKLTAGYHELTSSGFLAWPEVAAAAAQVAARPALAGGGATPAPDLPSLKTLWQYAGFDTTPVPLRIASVQASEPGKAPLERLYDGEYKASTNSVGFPVGKPVTITLELTSEAEVRTVLLREWHMLPQWDLGERTLEVSSDGFAKDVRRVAGPFVDRGRDSFGSNVNTLMELPVGQRARQIRLTASPARPECYVYLAEIALHGNLPGATPQLTASAVGDLDGDGTPEVVVGTASGQIQALDAAGKPRWSYRPTERGPANDLACIDVNGDGKAEVIYGGNRGRLGLLGPDGKPVWEITLPPFRGVNSDVKTIFPADVNGDGTPEIVCGCASWQYFALDAAGKELWRNTIYAHSATAGQAADLDGDGKQEVIAGNNYYTLNVIDHDGGRLWRSSNIGPEMTAVAALNLDADPQPEVLTGVDGGLLYCYDGDGRKLWEANLGDKVTRILSLDVNGDGQAEIVCAAESAHVFALARDGSILWRSPLPDGAADLMLTQDGALLAAAGSAGALRLDPAGKVTAAGAAGSRIQRLLPCGTGAVAITSDGKVLGLDLGRE